MTVERILSLLQPQPLRAPDDEGAGGAVSTGATPDAGAAAAATVPDAQTIDRQETAELSDVFDRVSSEGQPQRGPDGKFAPRAGAAAEPGPAAEGDQAPLLEGGEAEPDPDDASSTVSTDGQALPANWVGKEALWGQIPPELRPAIAEHQREMHSRMSEQGRQLGAIRPVAQALGEFSEYFDGSLKGSDGSVVQYQPADAVRFLFQVQKSMDNAPIPTILEIADRYGIRSQLAAALGGAGGQESGDSEALPTAELHELRSTVAELRAQLAGLADPDKLGERIDTVMETKAMSTELAAFASSPQQPLFADVAADMPFFISKAWAKLGANATRLQVLSHAYKSAVAADPELARKQAALDAAATRENGKGNQQAAAKAINITSQRTGKARQQTEDELLSETFDRAKAS